MQTKNERGSRGWRWSRKPSGHQLTSGAPKPPSKRQLRRRLYGVIQRLCKKNRSHCAKTVLSGDCAKKPRTTTLEEQEAYWKLSLRNHLSSIHANPSQLRERDTRYLYQPPPRSMSVSSSLLTTVPSVWTELTGRFYVGQRPGLESLINLWLLACRPPEPFKEGITVSLPKAADATGPAEYRPITMGSMFCHLFHRVVAHTAERALPLGPRQKAFREGDGLADNVWILQSIINDCKARRRPLCVMFIDVRKAFDPVSHESIVKAPERIGFPPGLVSYIRCLYTNGITQIRVGCLLGSLIQPLRGVRQGDPLSPLLFCAVMDWVLSQLDQGPVPVG